MNTKNKYPRFIFNNTTYKTAAIMKCSADNSFKR